MVAGLSVLVIVVANFSLGWLVWRALGGRPAVATSSLITDHSSPVSGRPTPTHAGLETAFASLALGTTVMGWLALGLAEVGWFSAGRLAVGWAVGCVLAAIRIGASSKWRVASEIQNPKSKIQNSRLLLLWLPAALWLFFRPHEFILGGADAGVYVNLAANIARTGSILIEDGEVAGLGTGLYSTLLRPLPEGEAAPYFLLPGFYVVEAATGQVTPQFYHLHPVWQAVAYGLGGVRAALLMTGLWALLGCLAVYLAARQIGGRLVATLALAGLTLNGLQVWFARYPTAETLTQFLLWTGLWSLGAWLGGRRPGRGWALLAGLALGEVLLARIDMYFLLGLPVALFLWMWWRGEWTAGAGWFFVPLIFLTTHSFVHGWGWSRPYFVNTFGYGLGLLGVYWPWLAGLALAGGLLLVWAAADAQRISGWAGRKLLNGRVIWLAAVALVVGWTAYGWFIRPQLGPPHSGFADWYGGGTIPNLDHENLIRLGWYLSPVGVWLAVGGVAWLLWRPRRQTVIILGVGLFFSWLYLWRIQNNPHQIYTMRRYVPVALPFLTIAAAYFVGRFGKSPYNWMLAAVWLAGVAWSARGFVSQVDSPGMIQQIDKLQRQFAPGSILLFADSAPVGLGDLIGTPLHFLYGFTVYSVRDPGAVSPLLVEQIGEWRAGGRAVYWIGDVRWLGEAAGGFGPLATVAVTNRALENSYERKPQRVIETEWVLEIRTAEDE